MLRHRWFYWTWLLGAFLGGMPITIAAALLTGSLWAIPVVAAILLVVTLVIDWQIEVNTSRPELVEAQSRRAR
ncbi:MAG: hypothetical protein U1E29_10500 [Coriobacteriia bacterium]|nr:hypothetical protein [Coriobacteriia bacterium]